MPQARFEMQRTVHERGTLKTSVRNALTRWEELRAQYYIPDDARVAVEIPGGCDYSSERIDADDLDLVVTWERQTEVE